MWDVHICLGRAHIHVQKFYEVQVWVGLAQNNFRHCKISGTITWYWSLELSVSEERFCP